MTLGAVPASADVTVTPGQAVQGGAAKLTFRVTEDRAPAYTTRIELRMPESAPVAETYPMSVSDWAPRIVMRKVDGTLGGIHHGQVTEVVDTITWTRAGAPAAGGGPAELVISLGPMPQTDQMTFVVVQTYSDGVVTTWDQPPSAEVPQPDRPAPVVALAPAGAPAPADGGAPVPEVPEQTALPGDEDDGNGFGMLLIGLATGLLVGLAVAGWMFVRRSRAGAEPERTGSADRAAESPTGPASDAESTGSADPESDTPADQGSTGSSTRDRASSGGRAWRLRE